MKILQIATIGLPVTPDLRYGGTERVISYLDQVYTKWGHESVVAATGDSKVKGELIETILRSAWSTEKKGGSERRIKKSKGLEAKHYQKCIEALLENPDIDIVHDHPGSGLMSSREFQNVVGKLEIPILQTLHGSFSERHRSRYDLWQRTAREYGGAFFNAISNSQKREFEENGFKIEDVVYHGIPINKFIPSDGKKEDYLFSIGRISPEKSQHLAIEVAKRTGRPLIIAGEVHSVNESYWREMIEPHIDGTQIRFVGPKTDEEKIPLYQNAAAYLFPIQWSEPFGLVMIEAMACGTPVIAYDQGSVPEVIKDRETGFIIPKTNNKETDLEAMVEAVNNIGAINSEDCRNHVVENFSIENEARSYLGLYKRLINLCFL